MKFALLIVLLGVLSVGCDRRVEPYVVAEKPQQPDLAKIFPAGAERAEADAVLPPAPGRRGAPPIAEASPVATAAAPVRGTATLAPELAGRVPDGAVLFLIARSGGPGPPMAVKRIADPSFPLDFTIGSEDRMIQRVPFTGPMRITARVDADGNATTRGPADLQGAAQGVHQPGATGVSVLIDERYSEADDASVDATVASGGGPISGSVSLAPEFADAVPPGALLFLIARTSATGPPLAVKRIIDPTFPVDFSIGPGDRMVESFPFAGEIQISARVDSDGNAISRTPGDLYGASARAHAPGESDVKVVVDQVVPAR